MYVKRRKALGNKRNDISEEDIAEITKIYGDFKESEISQIYDNEDFGYTKITVERPLRDEEGNLVLKKGKKQPDTSLRDTENVPLQIIHYYGSGDKEDIIALNKKYDNLYAKLPTETYANDFALSHLIEGVMKIK